MFWTEELYNMAYEKVKDRKWPVIIMSYNRPVQVAMKIFDTMNDEANYEVILFVRDSQKKMYEDKVTNKFVKVVSVPDEQINSAGKAREGSFRWLYNNGYEYAFAFDDDIPKLVFNTRNTTKNGTLISSPPKDYSLNAARVLAMWQLSMEVANKNYDVVFSGIRNYSSSWQLDNTDENSSLRLCTSFPSQVFCWNIKRCVEDYNLVYGDGPDVGFDDADGFMQLIDRGAKFCLFPFLAYDSATEQISVKNFKEFNSPQERTKKQSEKIVENWGEKDFYKVAVNKYGHSVIKFNFRQIRKNHGLKDYKFNIINLIRKGD